MTAFSTDLTLLCQLNLATNIFSNKLVKYWLSAQLVWNTLTAVGSTEIHASPNITENSILLNWQTIIDRFIGHMGLFHYPNIIWFNYAIVLEIFWKKADIQPTNEPLALTGNCIWHVYHVWLENKIHLNNISNFMATTWEWPLPKSVF